MSPSVVLESQDFIGALIGAKSRGVHTRYVVEITKDNIQHCKELAKIVSNLRHLNGAVGNFVVTDSEYLGFANAFLRKSESTHLFYSTVETAVRQNQYMFRTLWNNSLPAEVRIRELEEGVEPLKVELIHDPAFARDVFGQLVVSAARDIMVIFPTVRAFHRHEKMGTMQLLAGATKQGARIRVIMVKDKSSEKAVQEIQRQNDSVAVRFIKKDERSADKTTSLMVDNKSLLVIELKDDSKDDFALATGLTTFSNSGPGISAFVSMFEDLWMQSQIFEQILEANRRLASANEQLKVQSRLQEEFINIAAHELRTPIQPILGAIDIIRLQQRAENGATANGLDAESEEMNIIFRNVQRLERLSKDILDVARIESGSFGLNKERFDLNAKVRSMVAEMQDMIPAQKKHLEILAETSGNSLTVSADKRKVGDAISNLVSNAIKFADSGSITVRVGTKDGMPSVEVTDEGTGIDPEIVHKLFVKFASKSEKGTGLGLYISKKIIESHGGRIWGKNNSGGAGATFGFTLPFAN